MKKIVYIICLLGLGFSQPSLAGQIQQDTLDLQVSWQPLENNFLKEEQALSVLEIKNNSTKALGKGWSIYFNFIRIISPHKDEQLLAIEHLNGDYFRLSPGKKFSALQPGQSIRWEMLSSAWLVNLNDAPQGFYIKWDNGRIQPLRVVKVLPPPDARKFFRVGADEEMTAEALFEKNAKVALANRDSVLPIFPSPVSYTRAQGTFRLDRLGAVSYDLAFTAQAEQFNEDLNTLIGRKLAMTASGQDQGATSIALYQQKDLADEAYRLIVDPKGVKVYASTSKGIFYGLQSLKSMIYAQQDRGKGEAITLPSVSVFDEPRFGRRALMLDVARNFQTKEQIKKILDLMALYKLNTLHFHLNDDEGWRVEIPALPELTEVGSQRGHFPAGENNLPPSYGSGANPGNPPGSGYYSVADFVEILRYASLRNIQVIPEIETPGHARAAIRAMEVRYRRLLAAGDRAGAESYLLQDFADSSVYRSVQKWNDNVMDVAMPSVYNFLESVTDGLIEIYKQAHVPLETIHFGGDEVPKGVWQGSPAFSRLAKSDTTVKHTDDLWDYFFERAQAMLARKGLYLSGWEEVGLHKVADAQGNKKWVPNTDFKDRNIHLNVWNNLLGNEDLAYRLANAGYKVVISFVSNFYLDMAYYKKFDEPGFYWGGFIGLDKPYSFIPFDYLKNQKDNYLGRPLSAATLSGAERLSPEGKKNIVGLQALLWSETVKTPGQMEYLMFPRLLAFAEKAWAKEADWEREADPEKAQQGFRHSLSGFYATLGFQELPKLDRLPGGVRYRLPAAGLRLSDGKVQANCELPGFTIRYTTDGTTPTAVSAIYTDAVPYSAGLVFAVFNEQGRHGATSQLKTDASK